VLASLTGKSTVDLGKFVFEIKDINIENVPKTSVEEINKFRACFIEGVIGDSGKGLPSDYEFFGEKNSNVEVRPKFFVSSFKLYFILPCPYLLFYTPLQLSSTTLLTIKITNFTFSSSSFIFHD
jgi:hypothetical protein